MALTTTSIGMNLASGNYKVVCPASNGPSSVGLGSRSADLAGRSWRPSCTQTQSATGSAVIRGSPKNQFLAGVKDFSSLVSLPYSLFTSPTRGAYHFTPNSRLSSVLLRTTFTAINRPAGTSTVSTP